MKNLLELAEKFEQDRNEFYELELAVASEEDALYETEKWTENVWATYFGHLTEEEQEQIVEYLWAGRRAKGVWPGQ